MACEGKNRRGKGAGGPTPLLAPRHHARCSPIPRARRLGCAPTQSSAAPFPASLPCNVWYAETVVLRPQLSTLAVCRGGDQHAPYHSMQRGRCGIKSRSPRRRHQGADLRLPRRVTAGASAAPLPPRPWPLAPCARAHARAIRPSPHAPRSARRPHGHPPHAPAGLAEAAAGGPPRHAGEAVSAHVAGAGHVGRRATREGTDRGAAAAPIGHAAATRHAGLSPPPSPPPQRGRPPPTRPQRQEQPPHHPRSSAPHGRQPTTGGGAVTRPEDAGRREPPTRGGGRPDRGTAPGDPPRARRQRRPDAGGRPPSPLPAAAAAAAAAAASCRATQPRRRKRRRRWQGVPAATRLPAPPNGWPLLRR